jgi:hypothetical protein
MNDAGESCYPSIKTLAKETGLSRQTVIEHLNSARDAGWISVRRHGFSGQIWKRNEYSIMWPAERAVNQGDHEAVNQGDHEAVNQGDHEAVNQGDHEAVNQGDLSLSVVNSSKSIAIARRIFEDLRKLNRTHREPAWSTWTKDIDQMLAEGRSADEVLELWEFAHAHSFWRTNILSPGALRKQWDRLIVLRSSSKEVSSAKKAEDSRCSRIYANGGRCPNPWTTRRPGQLPLCGQCRDVVERAQGERRAAVAE